MLGGDLLDEFKEDAHTGCGQAARGVEGVERKALVGPVGEEFDEAAGAEVVAHAGAERLGDACAAESCGEKRRDIIDEKAMARLDGDDLAAAVELPYEGLAGGRVAELDGLMIGEIAG